MTESRQTGHLSLGAEQQASIRDSLCNRQVQQCSWIEANSNPCGMQKSRGVPMQMDM